MVIKDLPQGVTGIGKGNHQYKQLKPFRKKLAYDANCRNYEQKIVRLQQFLNFTSFEF